MKTCRWIFALGALSLLLPTSPADEPAKGYPTMGKIERLDPAFDKLIPKDAVIEKLATGFIWTEGPAWVKDGYLLFSDIPNNVVNKWQEGKGISQYLKPSGYTGKKPRGGKPGDEP